MLFPAIRMIKGSLVAIENKSTAGSSNILRGTMKSLFDAKLNEMVRPRNLYFNLERFMIIVVDLYYGVVTVTQLDFGPRVLLTTAAIA